MGPELRLRDAGTHGRRRGGPARRHVDHLVDELGPGPPLVRQQLHLLVALLALDLFDVREHPPIGKGPVVPNAAIRRVGDSIGVWKLEGGDPVFVPVELGKADLGGRVQVLKGLDDGDTIIVYSEQELTGSSNISVVDRILGVTP